MKKLTAATLAVFTFCGLFAASASGAFIVHLIAVVISPYYPHNRVVVRGIQSGYLVMDPSVGKAFIRP